MSRRDTLPPIPEGQPARDFDDSEIIFTAEDMRDYAMAALAQRNPMIPEQPGV
jgi:hypothetical protein